MTITPDQYIAGCKPRFGTMNPERIVEPVWEWMIREQHNPYSARQQLGIPRDYSGCQIEWAPEWCFQRMGAAVVSLADGKTISIAGEHEDWYDPDFCIYNDVVVRRGDEIEIYAYPREVSPPTDFHTAMRVGRFVWIIGALGYPGERGRPSTPIFMLDTDTYEIHRVDHTGLCPGWIHRHRARLRPDGITIEIEGGEVVIDAGEQEEWKNNIEVYAFDTQTRVWSKETDRSNWRQFRFRYDESVENMIAPRAFGWYTGEILAELGYPVECAKDRDEEGPDDLERSHTFDVDGVRVRILGDRYHEMLMIIEGDLPEPVVTSLVARVRVLLESSDRKVEDVQEC